MSQITSITALASISPLGNDQKTIWENYLSEKHFFSKKHLDNQESWVASLDENLQQIVAELQQSDIKYKSLDKSVLYAMAASRQAVANAGWDTNSVFGINIGSSRGACNRED